MTAGSRVKGNSCNDIILFFMVFMRQMKRGHHPPIAPRSNNRLHLTVESGESDLYRRLLFQAQRSSSSSWTVFDWKPSFRCTLWQGVAVDAAMFAAAIGIEAGLEADVRAVRSQCNRRETIEQIPHGSQRISCCRVKTQGPPKDESQSSGAVLCCR